MASCPGGRATSKLRQSIAFKLWNAAVQDYGLDNLLTSSNALDKTKEEFSWPKWLHRLAST